MLPALIRELGGADHLATIRRTVRPESLEADLALWVKDSDEQEGGFVDASTIAALSRMGATLGIGVYSRHNA